MDLAWQDPRSNREKVIRLLEHAALPRESLVLAPEMTDTGFTSTVFHDAARDGPAFAASVARRFGIWYQHGCTFATRDGFGRNVAVVASPDGAVVATYAKIHPFGYGTETDGFRGGDSIAVFEAAGAAVSSFICYDLRFPEVWRLSALAGAEVFAIGANWPSARQRHWRSLVIARAIENQAWIVACNRTGRDPAIVYSGGSMVVSPQGDVVAEAGDDENVLIAEIDLAALRAWRERFPALRDVRRRFLGRVTCAPCDSDEVDDSGH